MSIFDTFSKFDIFSHRQKKLRGEVPDVYTYSSLPDPLRVQIIYIWQETLGVYHINRNFWGESSHNHEVEYAYQQIVSTLRYKYGVTQLPGSEKQYGESNAYVELVSFFHKAEQIERALDAIETSFRAIDLHTRVWDYRRRSDASQTADAAIEELNAKFQEHGVGYQFAGGKIIRIDSKLIHSEIVKPALMLLQEPHYAGAQEEYLRAHEHYRKNNAKEALSECLKAFESVMKAICDKRGWRYDEKATATPLLDVCFVKELIPQYWQSHYSSLRSLLQSSVPTGRNRSGGHGQGTNPMSVPNHIVAYMLHMTASAIVFLAEAEKQLP